MSATAPIRLFVLQSGWGVPFPTGAPFPLKLGTWMRMMGVDFEWVVENDTRKGPKGKSPWIEHGEVRMGDSSLIMEYLTEALDLPNLDRALSAEQRALSVATQRMLEEHYHQCFEHQLFFGQGGKERFAEMVETMPPIVNILLPRLIKRNFATQLRARGMGRHCENVIIEQGKADLDALSALLGQKPYFHGAEPTEIDACVFGFLGVTVYVEGDNALFDHAASQTNLMRHCERMRARFFPETLESLAA